MAGPARGSSFRRNKVSHDGLSHQAQAVPSEPSAPRAFVGYWTGVSRPPRAGPILAREGAPIRRRQRPLPRGAAVLRGVSAAVSSYRPNTAIAAAPPHADSMPMQVTAAMGRFRQRWRHQLQVRLQRTGAVDWPLRHQARQTTGLQMRPLWIMRKPLS